MRALGSLGLSVALVSVAFADDVEETTVTADAAQAPSKPAGCKTDVVRSASGNGASVELRAIGMDKPDCEHQWVLAVQPKGAKAWLVSAAYDASVGNCGVGRCIDEAIDASLPPTITVTKDRAWVVLHVAVTESGERHPQHLHWLHDVVIGCSLAAAPRCVVESTGVFTSATATISGDTITFDDPTRGPGVPSRHVRKVAF